MPLSVANSRAPARAEGEDARLLPRYTRVKERYRADFERLKAPEPRMDRILQAMMVATSKVPDLATNSHRSGTAVCIYVYQPAASDVTPVYVVCIRRRRRRSPPSCRGGLCSPPRPLRSRRSSATSIFKFHEWASRRHRAVQNCRL